MYRFVVPEFVYGCGCRRMIGEHAADLGMKRPLLVTDPGLIEAGWAKEISAFLRKAALDPVVFSDVTPNPKDHEVMTGVAKYREAECDGLVALGGGSPMDCAKGIGAVVSNGGCVLRYEGVDMIGRKLPPMICMPSTAGTAADISRFAIINDTEARRKIAIVSNRVMPDLSLIDPNITLTMSRELTAETGMDALVHAIEAYVSKSASPLTDLHATRALSILSESLVPAVENPRNLRLRERMMRASLHAGMAFSNASLGLVHAMAHALGGLADVTHGTSNAILLPHVIRFNFNSARARYIHISRLMGVECEEDRGESLMTFFFEWMERFGLPAGLSEMGFSRKDIPLATHYAMEDVCWSTNPREARQHDIQEIFEAAL